MKKTFFLIVVCVVLCIFNVKISAQEKLHYWNDSETFLQDQASLIFEEVYRILAAHPPGTTVSSERRLALLSLDALLHDTRLDKGKAFMAHMQHITANIAAELRKRKPSEREIRYFLLYNHGFIVQTPDVTVAIDLVRGGNADQRYISDTLMRSIVEQCDILFISHVHGDHADRAVAQMFCEQGKNVIVPEEFWKDMAPQLRVVRGTDMTQEMIRLPARNTSLSVRIYPGYQGNILNNVYSITLPGGQTIVHTGDQSYNEDMAAKIGASKIDVLLVQCWMMPMEKFVSGVKPALIITGHANEMGHSIDHREAYWLTFRRMSEVKVPYIVMAWGESYTVAQH